MSIKIIFIQIIFISIIFANGDCCSWEGCYEEVYTTESNTGDYCCITDGGWLGCLDDGTIGCDGVTCDDPGGTIDPGWNDCYEDVWSPECNCLENEDDCGVCGGDGSSCIDNCGNLGFSYTDCSGFCFNNSECSDGCLNWLDDSSCDDGEFGLYFNCEEWGYDGADCSTGWVGELGSSSYTCNGDITGGGCDIIDDCSGTNDNLDDCGVCNGNGSTCGDCDGINGVISIIDDCNVCGGNNASMDVCGVCDGNGSTCQGCTDDAAYNYNDEATIDDNSCISYGDVNLDGDLNVSDIVIIINFIVDDDSNPSVEEFTIADFNSDNIINILDVVQIINTIFGDALSRGVAVSNSIVFYGNGILKYKSDGQIAGIQLEVSGDYTIIHKYLSKGWHLESSDNIIIIYSMDGTPLDSEKLFEYEGNLKINSIIIADWYNSNVNVESVLISKDYQLSQAYPNPFNPVTSFQYSIPIDGMVNISVYNINGRIIAELVDSYVSSGTYIYKWNANNASSGVYFIRMVSGNAIYTQKIMLLK